MEKNKAGKRSVGARVRVEVELDSGSCWESGTTVEQVTGQATRETSDKIRKILCEAKVRFLIRDAYVISIYEITGKD